MWKFKHVAVLFVLFLCACTGATEEECTVTTHTPTCNGAIKYMSKQGKYIGQRYMYYSNTTATNRCFTPSIGGYQS